MTTDHIDHRAEAEKLIASVMGPNPDVATPQEARDIVALAQVHATLAAGTPIADRHLLDGGASAAGKYRELQAAVRDYLGELRVGHKGGEQLTVLKVLVR